MRTMLLNSTDCGTMEAIDVRLFNLRHTFESAQPLTFHGEYDSALDRLHYMSDAGRVEVISEKERGYHRLYVSGKNARREVERRFRLSDNMGRIYKRIGTDAFVSASIKNYEGMRLTVNDPWETTVCFITSQFNNVKRIRLIVKNLINRFGTPVYDREGGLIGKTFPKSDVMQNATIAELTACGTGFRAKYIRSAAEYCTNNLDLYNLNPKNYNALKEQIMQIDGVGEKVADCIILMGYGNLEAFPIDVWIKRTMENLYFSGKEQKMRDIHEFAESTWGKYRGYAQQYLFHNARANKMVTYDAIRQ
jgi:N-glycosylase/DNA lyase